MTSEIVGCLTADEVWTVLVEECGAPDDKTSRMSFQSSWPCDEYRFQGALGFGGKVRAYYIRPFGDDDLRARVDCYAEDMTDERQKMIAKANARLGHHVTV